MAVSGNIYANAFDKAFNGQINWASDSIKMALLTSTYTPNLATHANFSDLTNEVTGTGYTAGGVALGTKTHVVTAANSFGTVRANSTAYVYGDLFRPSATNGFMYMVSTAGTSAAAPPTFPTVVGQTVTDGTAVITNIGESITQWSSAAASWTTATITARYGVIYDAQTGTAATEPLIALVNFGADVSSTAGNYTVTPDAKGWFWVTPA